MTALECQFCNDMRLNEQQIVINIDDWVNRKILVKLPLENWYVIYRWAFDAVPRFMHHAKLNAPEIPKTVPVSRRRENIEPQFKISEKATLISKSSNAIIDYYCHIEGLNLSAHIRLKELRIGLPLVTQGRLTILPLTSVYYMASQHSAFSLFKKAHCWYFSETADGLNNEFSVFIYRHIWYLRRHAFCLSLRHFLGRLSKDGFQASKFQNYSWYQQLQFPWAISLEVPYFSDTLEPFRVLTICRSQSEVTTLLSFWSRWR